MNFPGYAPVGEFMAMKTVKEVLDEVKPGESFGLSYFVSVPAYVYLNFFEIDEASFSLQMTFDSSLLFFENELNSAGALIERILTRVCLALQVDVGGYTTTERFWGEYNALTVDEVLTGIRSREWITVRRPFFYAIKERHISTKDLKSAISGTPAKYKFVGSHHVLSAWV